MQLQFDVARLTMHLSKLEQNFFAETLGKIQRSEELRKSNFMPFKFGIAPKECSMIRQQCFEGKNSMWENMPTAKINQIKTCGCINPKEALSMMLSINVDFQVITAHDYE